MMSDHIDSVNGIVKYLVQSKKAFEDRGNRERAVEMARFETSLRAFLRDFEDLESRTRPIPVVDGDDLSDLPPELLKELSVAKSDDLEDQIVTVVNAAGGEADIDTILIHLYRRFKVSQTRRFLQNKLWRMTQKGFLSSVDGKKGHYTTLHDVESDDDPVATEPEIEESELYIARDTDEIPF